MNSPRSSRLRREQIKGCAATTLAQRVIHIIAEPFSIDGHDLNIGTSIGIALAPEQGAPTPTLS